MMFFAFALQNVESSPWAFLITVSFCAGDAVLTDENENENELYWPGMLFTHMRNLL